MNNYEGNKKGFNRNNNFKKRNNGGNFKSNKDNKRAEIIAKQNHNIQIVDSVAEFLDNYLKTNDEPNTKISMQKVIDYLVNSKGYTQDDTKAVSQFNYLIMDLANAQRSTYINGNRVNIRILYIQERLKTSFKKELHNTIDDIITKYGTLFYWNEVSEEEENAGIEIIVSDETATTEAVETETATTPVEE